MVIHDNSEMKFLNKKLYIKINKYDKSFYWQNKYNKFFNNLQFDTLALSGTDSYCWKKSI